MTYNAVLDYYFSSLLLGLGLPVVLMVGYMLARKSVWRKNKPYSFGESLLNMGIAFVLIINWGLLNGMYYGYGHPAGIDEVRLDQGKLIVLDHINSMGSRYEAGESYYRIHVIDPSTGKKQLRFLVGPQANYIGVNDDHVSIAHYNDVGIYSLSNGMLLTTYSVETLPKLFARLSCGVNRFMWGDGRNCMEITAQDGNEWKLYTRTGDLVNVKKEKEMLQTKLYFPTRHLSLHENEIRIDDRPGGSTVLQLESEGENQHRLVLSDSRNSAISPDHVFLDGKIAGLDIKDSCCFILSYETLKKEKFRITCVALDGKKINWEISQAQFNNAFSYSESYSPQVSTDENTGLVCFSIDREIFAVRIKDGKLVWRTPL